MRHFLFALALAALAATSAGAQTGHEHHAMKADSAHRMKTPCPLHLETLSLTATQKLAIDSLRADHETIMKSVMKSHDKALMQSTMHLTVAAMRSILSDAQRTTFDAAVSAHAAEMKEMQAKGAHDCAACCAECMKHDAMHPAAAKKDG